MNRMKEDLNECLRVLRDGGVILYPTDTVWGIGCDATNEKAVRKVFEIKKRSDSKALIILTDAAPKIEGYVREMPEIAWQLIEYATKPLTIIYDGARNLAPNVIAEDGSVAIRVTSEEFTAELCKQFRRPIVSTSANISGEPAASNYAEISEEILRSVDYVVKYRQDDSSKPTPSSIIKLGVDGTIKIIRE